MINVCISTDNRFVQYVPSLLNSISQNSSCETRIFILGSCLTAAHTRKLETLALHNLTIRFIDVSKQFTAVKLHLLPHTTKSTMDRLFLPSLLPEIDKIIYLDIDVIVNNDLKELFCMSTSTKGLVAKSSIMKGYTTIGGLMHQWAYNKSFIDDIKEEIDINAPSFNAGVLVLDLKKLRDNNFEYIVHELVQKFRVNDQLALAIYANGEYEKLPCSWNVFANQEQIEYPNIIHWAGLVKPWQCLRNAPYQSFWNEYYLPL